MRRAPAQDQVLQIHATIHLLANYKARGGLIPISTTALIKWHKESASELMHHGLAHRSPLERGDIDGPIGSKF